MPSLRLTGRRGLHTAAATAFTLAALALLLTALIGPEPPPRPPTAALQAPATSAPPGRPHPPATALPHSPPTRIHIPKLKTKTHVEHVGLAADGTLAMPADPDHAGWYTGSAAPGENGNAILVGHLDSSSGPAAFYGLGALRPGDRITVQRRDGRPAHFTVATMAVYAKDAFPSQRVYAPTPQPHLTLITCAGWDDDRRTYRSNLVITAHP